MTDEARRRWSRRGSRLLAAASVLALATASSGAEDEGWFTVPFTPLQFAFVPGYGQIFSKPTPVYGLRVSALYGMQSEVVGLDAGFFSQTDTLTGVGVGVCNVAVENSLGVHLGIACNQVEADFVGLEIGAINLVRGEFDGLQIGVANGAGSGAALQIGLVNGATSMRGVQLGLINLNENGFLPFFPVLNFGF